MPKSEVWAERFYKEGIVCYTQLVKEKVVAMANTKTSGGKPADLLGWPLSFPLCRYATLRQWNCLRSSSIGEQTLVIGPHNDCLTCRV